MRLVVVQEMLGRVYLVSGQHQKAVACFSFCFDALNQHSEPDTDSLALYAAILADLLRLLGDPQANAYYDVSMEVIAGSTGVSRTLYEAHYYLARYARRAGDVDQMEKHANRALSIAMMLFPREDPDRAACMDLMGGFYADTGRFDRCLDLTQQAFEIRSKLFGERHADTIGSMNNMGTLHLRLGHYDEGIDWLFKARGLAVEAMGSASKAVGVIDCNLGNAYSRTGRYVDAETAYLHSLDVLQKVEAESERLPTLYINLAAVYSGMERYEEAERNLTRAAEIYDQTYDSDHPKRALINVNLAEVYQKMGRIELSDTIYQRARDVFIEAFGPDHFAVGEVLRGMAVNDLISGRLAQAQAKAEEAEAILLSALGEEHDITARNRALMGEILVAQGHPEQSIDYFKAAIKTMSEIYGSSHPEVVKILGRYAAAVQATEAENLKR